MNPRKNKLIECGGRTWTWVEKSIKTNYRAENKKFFLFLSLPCPTHVLSKHCICNYRDRITPPSKDNNTVLDSFYFFLIGTFVRHNSVVPIIFDARTRGQ